MIQKFVKQMFVVLGTHYSSMERWQRNACLKLIHVGELAFETVPYLAFMVLPIIAFRGEWSFTSIVVASWCISEILFHIYSHVVIYKLTKNPKHHIPMTQDTRKTIALQVCDHLVDPDAELRGWMHPTPKGRLHINDILTWVAWGFFGKDLSEITQDEQPLVKEVLDIFNNKLQCNDAWPRKEQQPTYTIRPTLDALDLGIKSLAMYAFFSVLKIGICTAWCLDGFRFEIIGKGVSYWIREPEDEEGEPIMLLHGGGVGIYMYATQIAYLVRKYPKRRIILYIISNACLAPASDDISVEDIISTIDILFANEKVSKVSIIAHSFGTMVAGFLVLHRPQYLARLTFVDPICFMIYDSSFAFLSLYAKPTCLFHHIYYILSRDPVFASFLHNQWLPVFLFFPESITVPATIYVAERDWIVDGRKTFNYLQDRKAKSNLDNVDLHLIDMTHGEYLYSMERIKRFSAAL
ncbi:hypothetical protein DSO57_1012711 [Entomophthora muscae]|uniref:Uncharacterized protein n=1 Tax=Entomophthora muscae TaxID=34485 RepID=A0ACC2SIX8_9FUNG|nr:hypothetical protein DSO57_1012711 [Entomophthora muscae]